MAWAVLFLALLSFFSGKSLEKRHPTSQLHTGFHHALATDTQHIYLTLLWCFREQKMCQAHGFCFFAFPRYSFTAESDSACLGLCLSGRNCDNFLQEEQ